MSTLSVQVAPFNPGEVHVRVWVYTSPGPSFEWNGTATTGSPISESWDDLEPGHYAVTISWAEGYQNIASGIAGNQIVYNGNYLYYQVLGSPADGNGVSAVFGLVI
ncbi:hypothetical protein ACQKOH_14585 [Sphingomonas sp. NPDC092331]|jgi:hypothetical protein|uniref:hypothetical protein n=1 Tax=unclassified Sphingomonas TaxID=196159 RepID=UPI0031F4AC43